PRRYVSCAAPGNSSALGRYDDSLGHARGLLLPETAGTWAPGIESGLPANAASVPNVGLHSVSCAAPGSYSAVGSYPDNAATTQGLLLTETAGTWTAGVEASLPANA